MSNDAPQIVKTITCHTDMIYSLAINRDGSLIATTSKDRKLRVIEPRSGIVISVSNFMHTKTKQKKNTNQEYNYLDIKFIIFIFIVFNK